MFSGIVTALGQVASPLRPGDPTLRLAHPLAWGHLAPGDSVAVNGCCLTVVAASPEQARVDVVPETLRRTNLGLLRKGDRVNLEAALGLGEAVGGHLLSGHIDGTGRVLGLEPEGNAVWLTLELEARLGRYCVPQGAIALDGCSLTLVEVADEGPATRLRISLIPHTLASTIAAAYRPGTVVNVEVDSLAKLVERLLEPHLARAGAGEVA